MFFTKTKSLSRHCKSKTPSVIKRVTFILSNSSLSPGRSSNGPVGDKKTRQVLNTGCSCDSWMWGRLQGPLSPEDPGPASAGCPGWSRPPAVCRSPPRHWNQDWRSAEIQDLLSGLETSQECRRRFGNTSRLEMEHFVKHIQHWPQALLLYSGALLCAWFCWPAGKDCNNIHLKSLFKKKKILNANAKWELLYCRRIYAHERPVNHSSASMLTCLNGTCLAFYNTAPSPSGPSGTHCELKPDKQHHQLPRVGLI